MVESLRLAPQSSAPPSPASLLCLGVTLGLYGIQASGVGHLHPNLLGAGFLYGGLGLLLLGLSDWRHNSPLGAVLGIAYGLFWLSLLGMIALPAAGMGHAPVAASTGTYLAMWGVFTGILFAGAQQGGRGLQGTLGLLVLSLLLLATAELAGNRQFGVAGGWVAMAAGLVAVHNGTLRILFEARRQTEAPPASVRIL